MASLKILKTFPIVGLASQPRSQLQKTEGVGPPHRTKLLSPHPERRGVYVRLQCPHWLLPQAGCVDRGVCASPRPPLSSIYSQPPAFVLSATQPSPTVHSPLVSRLPSRVTGGESWEGLRDSPSGPDRPAANAMDSVLSSQWTPIPTSSSMCPRKRTACASTSMRSLV